MKHIVESTPQKNGVCRTKNHTLKEMANRMIQSKGSSINYWEESIKFPNYIKKFTPRKDLKIQH
jgi:hypothetical protein